MNRIEMFILITILFALSTSTVTVSQAETNDSKNMTANDNTQDDPVAIMPPPNKIPLNLLQVGNGSLHPKHIFIADKSKRTLTIWNINDTDFSLQGAYPMDIGKNSGDKLIMGDHKTPEGVYFFQERKEGPTLDFNEYGVRAFTMDYPNVFDKHYGKTGHGIWLHAIPETKSLLRGSRGCVVVRNEIIEKLTPLINVRQTPIIVTDEVKYVSVDAQKVLQDKFLTWIERWRTSWESKVLDDYMSFYAEDFKFQRMNKAKWRNYKKELNARYSYINVQIKNPMIIGEKDHFIIQALQEYKSDTLNDVGEKMLYVRKTGDNNFEIVSEIWRPLSSDFLASKPQ